MTKFHYKIIVMVCIGFLLIGIHRAGQSFERISEGEKTSAEKDPKMAYQEYIDFFEKVYDTMVQNYYQDVSRERFESFIEQFKEKIYSQLKETGKSDNYVRWRSASLLVQKLKSEEDIFSEFYPPKPAKEYQQTALGKRVDLGIQGELIDDGYQVTHVEPRSDTYGKGLRKDDVIVGIDDQRVRGLELKEVQDLLVPLVDSKIKIAYLASTDKKEKTIEVLSKEYFKQTVFMVPVKIPDIFCLQIQRFNRTTADDLVRHLRYFMESTTIKGLIIDLRNNPGGPPLAAREISAFFLPPGEDFAYFHKKGHSKAMLDIPLMAPQYHYEGPMVILVNEKSGSASELFSGILQRRGRAILMGTNSAGQVMLKSMFHFEDESMVLLITSPGYHPDGTPFSFKGLIPDRYIGKDEDRDIVHYAATYLMYINLNQDDKTE